VVDPMACKASSSSLRRLCWVSISRNARPCSSMCPADMGAYVQLLEYNNIEGMVLLSELSRRRIRSINKLIKVRHRAMPHGDPDGATPPSSRALRRSGATRSYMVIRVDKDKGYIDLSKRRVSAEEIVKAEDRLQQGQDGALHPQARLAAPQRAHGVALRARRAGRCTASSGTRTRGCPWC